MADQAVPGTRLRKYPRLAVSFPVTFRIAADGAVKSGLAHDIGGGGISFESAERLAPDTGISLYFALRPDLEVEALGRVVASQFVAGNNAYHHRVMFTQVADDVRAGIIDYIFQAWRSALMGG